MVNGAKSHASLVREHKDWAARGFLRFDCDGEVVGWLHPSFAPELRRWPDCFDVADERVAFAPRLRTPAARTAALAACVCDLAKAGIIAGWRDERYTICSGRDGNRLFDVERAAVRRFGLIGHAAHLNGYVGNDAALRMWVARRSQSKAIDPGRLDSLVGGGVAAGYTAWETLLKESEEEAGIPCTLASAARPAGFLWSEHEVADGLHREVLFVYDLALPASFVPVNGDGEVAAFHLMSVEDVRRSLQRGQFSVEAGLVADDFLCRRDLGQYGA